MQTVYKTDTGQSAFMQAIDSQLQEKTKRQEVAQLRLYNLTKLSLFLVACVSVLILVCYDLQVDTAGGFSNMAISNMTASNMEASPGTQSLTLTTHSGNKHLVEHLQAIRLHNVTRNINDELLTSVNQMPASQVTQNQNEHLSLKQAQVKAWERAFTSD